MIDGPNTDSNNKTNNQTTPSSTNNAHNKETNSDETKKYVDNKENIKLGGLLFAVGNLVSGGVGTIGILIYYMIKKDSFSLEEIQAYYYMFNFYLSYILYAAICFALFLVLIGIPLLILLIILFVIFTVLGLVKHLKGISYKYPMSIQFLKTPH